MPCSHWNDDLIASLYDELDAETVANRMRHISTVELTDLRVSPLSASP